MNSEQAKAARMAARDGKPVVPNGCCRFCMYKVPPRALWCSTECAQDYAAETRQLQAEGGAA